MIQMKDVRYFEPDREIHADFADALKEAAQKGVQIMAYDSEVTTNGMVIRDWVEVRI